MNKRKEAAAQSSTTNTATPTPSHKLARYAKAKGAQAGIIDQFRNLQIPSSVMSKLETCSTFFRIREYVYTGDMRIVGANHCKQRFLCLPCEVRRGSNYLAKYHQKFVALAKQNPNLRPYLITFTVKNSHDFSERQRHLAHSYRRFAEHSRYCNRKDISHEWLRVKGWVSSEETTHNPDTGFHPHLHVLVLANSSFNYRAIQREWLAATGDSHVVNVTKVDDSDMIKAMSEVFKYFVKPTDLAPQILWDVAQKMKGKRTIRSGGLFKGVSVDEYATDDIRDKDGQAYIDHYMRFNGQSFEQYQQSTGIQKGKSTRRSLSRSESICRA